jgi:hypothetical protein
MGRNLDGITIELGWKYEEKTETTLLARTDPRASPEDIIKAVMQAIQYTYMQNVTEWFILVSTTSA